MRLAESPGQPRRGRRRALSSSPISQASDEPEPSLSGRHQACRCRPAPRRRVRRARANLTPFRCFPGVLWVKVAAVTPFSNSFIELQFTRHTLTHSLRTTRRLLVCSQGCAPATAVRLGRFVAPRSSPPPLPLLCSRQPRETSRAVCLCHVAGPAQAPQTSPGAWRPATGPPCGRRRAPVGTSFCR